MKRNKKEFYGGVDQLLDSETFLQSLSDGFEDIEDPRVSDNKTYQLHHLLLIIVCAIIAGANSILDIHTYTQAKERLFKHLLGIKKTPSYSVFWWLLTRMNPDGLEQSLIGWIKSLPDDIANKIISIDGKRVRGAERNTKLHLVSAWDSVRSLLLGQVKTAEKSNEIRAIPELLEALDLHNAVVTIDAAGCQKEITKKIRAQGGDYVIALKGNQSGLLAEAEAFFAQAAAVQYEDTGCETFSSSNRGHGRDEERKIVVTNQLDWLDLRRDWEGLTTLVEVTSRRTIKEKTTEEKRYYISSKALGAKEAGTIIRSHWSVENRLHWSMDVNFLEDKCLASVGNAAENLSAFRRLAATLMRLKLGGVAGTANLRRKAQWDDMVMFDILSGIFSTDDVKTF